MRRPPAGACAGRPGGACTPRSQSGVATLSRLARADEDRGVAVGMAPVGHVLVGLADLVEAHHAPEHGVDRAVVEKLPPGARLLVVGAVAALESLLANPVVAQVDHRRV